MASWNPWHGCKKLSEGCRNCYVYRIDARHDRDASVVKKNSTFALPLAKARGGGYKLSPGETVYTCFSSDFLLEEADEWRPEAWAMMKERSDLSFLFITKRIHRFAQTLPPDWGEGYPNVTVCCTVENQDRADFRLPIYLNAPIAHKFIVCEPLLGEIELSRFLTSQIEGLIAGGESGTRARKCRYEWVLSLREQCAERGVPFHFKQTGYRFRRDGRLYTVPRSEQGRQARKANIDLR